MHARRQLLAGGAVAGFFAYFGLLRGRAAQADGAPAAFEVTHTDEEWRRLLQPAQYQILRQHGTERAGSSPLDHEFRKGVYSCAACGLPLFSSDTKFDSGTGWPSFWLPIEDTIGTSPEELLCDSD